MKPLTCRIAACVLLVATRVPAAPQIPAADTAGVALSVLRAQLAEAQRQPHSIGPFRQLYSSLREMSHADLREPLSCAVALGLLYNGQEDAFERMRASVRQAFKGGQRAALLETDSLCHECPTCNGSGKSPEDCDTCGGTGSCQNAKCEKGQISYKGSKGMITRKCPTCAGSVCCTACKGAKQVQRTCRKCGGTGKLMSRSRVKELLLTSIADCTAIIDVKEQRLARLRKMSGATDNGTAELTPTGRTVTPDHLKEPLSQFGQWLVVQQRRLGVKIVTRIYAKEVGPSPVLHLVVHSNFSEQDLGWRQKVSEAIRHSWTQKCPQDRSAAAKPGVVLLDEDGQVVGESKGGAPVHFGQ